ncbi:MAG TPA: hypothetical protein EYG92_09760 [Lutibacter sp.]|nr:hypothetical protein [Lutibacter sp.]
MKHLFLGFFAAAFLLTSCSTEETVSDINDTNSNLLQSFEIKRNVDGSYALTHEVSEGVSIDYTTEKSTNEVYFYTNNDLNKTNLSQNFNINDNRLNIVFKDENNSSLPRLSIFDDNTFEKNNDLGLLDTYSILYNQDGSIQVDFKVEEGVDVAFGYNTDENTNDIYLTEGNSTQLNYTKNYNKEADGSLRVDFVQTTTKTSEIKKPRFIFD